MECKFIVGQKVESLYSWYMSPTPRPEKGGIYTIREIVDGVCRTGDPAIGLRFIELTGDMSWHYAGFRPLETRSTKKGMEILRKLLNPANCKKLAVEEFDEV